MRHELKRLPEVHALICVALGILGCGYAGAQWEKPVAEAVQADGAIEVDGAIEEDAWAKAPWYGDFTSASKGEENRGAPRRAEVQTRFRALYDRNAIYVAAECDEPAIDQMRASITQHDGTVWSDDCVEIFFDPAGEGRYYHHFAINSKGTWYEDYSADYGLVHGKLWDCAIETAARVDAAGGKWTVEAKIPFGGLMLHEDAGDTWLWNVTRERHAGGALELSSWSPLKGSFHSPRQFGKLTGVGVDYRPFAWAVSEPTVSVSRAGSGVSTLDISVGLKNETGADKAVIASAAVFGQPQTRVAAEPTTIAAGAEAAIAFPKLTVRTSLPQANVLLTFEDAQTGDLCRSVVKRLSADYRPISLTVLRPCYRNSIYATEKLESIVFRVTLAPDVAGRAAAIQYGLSGEDGGVITEAKADVPRAAEGLEIPAAELKVGSYTLSAEARDEEGEAVASATTTIRKLPPPDRGNEVRVDERGNVLVNGKPFVAIGWYGGVPTHDPRKDVVALQNLRTPQVVNMGQGPKLSPDLEEHGLYSIVSVENGRLYFSFDLWRSENKEKGDRVRSEMKELSGPSELVSGYLRELVATVRGEPGLLGYYIADEPEIHNTRSDYLENQYKLLCELDPYHPVIVTNDTLDGIVTHGYRCADILSPDPYSSNLDYVPNFMKRCREVLRPGQAIVLTPWHASSQAHTTADYGTAPPYPYRVMRNQYLVSLAYGARGWTGYTSAFFMPEIELRYGLPYIWREVRFLEEAISGPPPEEGLTVEADAEMASWIRQVNDRLYLVVVNHKPGGREAQISHPLLRGVEKLIVVSEGREVAVGDDGFADRFEEGDARIYTTDPAGARFTTIAAVEEELARRKHDSAKPGNLLHVSAGTRAAASQGYYAPWFDQYYYYAINGITDDLGWCASHAGGKPAWLELALAEPASIGRVVIHTPNLKDYDLSFQAPTGEVNDAEIRGNEETVVEHNFKPAVSCLKLRITALAARDAKLPMSSAPQVAEIEAYETAGEGRVTPLIPVSTTQALPESPIPADDPAAPNALWEDDFTDFEFAEKYNWDGKDTKWVLNPQQHRATPNPGGGIVCTTIGETGGAGMSHIFPYDPAYRFFQVNLSGIEGTGYRFVNVAFASSSGKPGYRGAVNTARPGIYTVDTHYIHDSFRTGAAKQCFLKTYMAKLLFTFDWMRLVRRPVDGLAVMMADGSPLPETLRQGDEVMFHLILDSPAADAVVDVLAKANYEPLQINGEPYVQLVTPPDGDGREWLAQVKLGEGTSKCAETKRGYPIVFRARITGGKIKETYASAFVGFE